MDRNRIAGDLLRMARNMVGLTEGDAKSRYLPKNKRVTKWKIKDTDVSVHTWENEGERNPYAALVYNPQTKNPDYVYARTEAEREKLVKRYVDNRRDVLERRRKRQEEQRQFKHDLQVGDILSSSWGYDQTNVDFYEVIGVTDKSVKIREVAQKVVRSSPPQDYVVAIPGKFIGAPMTKRVGTRGYVKVDGSQYASKWDGKPKYKTSLGWGH
jgi:hypothetical protein